MRRIFQNPLHPFAVGNSVRLHPLGLHRCAFSRIQCTGLNGAAVCTVPHFAAKCIQFKHQMPFPRSTYRRVAGHICHRIQTDCKHCRIQTAAGTGKCSFHTGVTRTHYDHIKIMQCHAVKFPFRNTYDAAGVIF